MKISNTQQRLTINKYLIWKWIVFFVLSNIKFFVGVMKLDVLIFNVGDSSKQFLTQINWESKNWFADESVHFVQTPEKNWDNVFWIKK